MLSDCFVAVGLKTGGHQDAAQKEDVQVWGPEAERLSPKLAEIAGKVLDIQWPRGYREVSLTSRCHVKGRVWV